MPRTYTIDKTRVGERLLRGVVLKEAEAEPGPEGDFEPEFEKRDCMVLLVSRDAVEGIEVEADHAQARTLELGSVVLLYRNDPAEIFSLHRAVSLNVRLAVPAGDGEHELVDPFSPVGREVMISRLAEAHAGTGAEDDALVANAARWVDALDGYMADLRQLAANEPDVVPARLATAAWMASTTDGMGHVEFPAGMTKGDLWRAATAADLRSRIARIDPHHPDAAGDVSLDEVVREAFAAEGLSGGQVRAPAFAQSADLDRMVKANDHLSREVFGAVARTPIEDLQCRIGSRDDIAAVRDRLEADGRSLEGPWVEAVTSSLRRVLDAAMPGYSRRCGIDLFTVGGRDILVVEDHVGGYLYSWPSAERRTIAEIDGRRVATATPREAPSPEEIERLTGVLEGLVAERARREVVDDEPGL